ncbi:uncharacterized protein LOC106874696 [Octopus bimaculoides]|uniref:Uncharacterized protein n=1 Tax=Octopus bimaculoides TaxID=37653 RepID=A0A0L8GUD1_OCTBM|nr:uncharacterized protein LOC106874696 [Octopus bimaculoides]|eukprot:XP_014777991.1 PREDICTED: uncharacterized protein LOC106874696 [Octopus bimaculoides]
MLRMDYKVFSKHFPCWINILLLCYNTLCSAVHYQETTTAMNSKSLSVQYNKIPITTEGFPNRIKNVQHFRVMETASYHLPALKDKQLALNDLPNLIAASTETPLHSKKYHQHNNNNYQWAYSKHKERKNYSPHLNLSLRDMKTKQDSRFSSKWRQISALGIHSSSVKTPELSKISPENVMVSGQPPLKSSSFDQQNPVTSQDDFNVKRKHPVLTSLHSVTTTNKMSIADNTIQSSTLQQTVSESMLRTGSQHKPDRVILLLTPTPVLSTLTTLINETQFENYSTTEEMPLKEANSSDIPEYLAQPPFLLNIKDKSSSKGSQSKERPLSTSEEDFDPNLPPLAQPAPSTHTRYGSSRRKYDSKNLPYTNPPKYGTQRPPRNILSLDVNSHHQQKGIKPTLMPSRSGLLHLTEDSETTKSHKPLVTNKIKDFTKKGLNGKILAAVTTEFLRPSEMIPDILIVPTNSQHTHPTPTKHGFLKPVLSTPTSATAALSLTTKNKHLILSATATLDPSKMTHLCTKPCSDDANCKCCSDKELVSVESTEQVIPKEPTDNVTPQTDVSTQKNPSKTLTLSAGFGIGMGCLIAIWLIVGPVVCLICHIKDKAKKEEEMDKKYQSVSPMQENSIAEALVMDELNKQFSKMKTNRENEYLWLARDKLELVSLSNADSSTQTTNQYLTSPTYTSALSYSSKKWLDSDDEDDDDYDDDDDSEDEKKDKLKYVPTVSV